MSNDIEEDGQLFVDAQVQPVSQIFPSHSVSRSKALRAIFDQAANKRSREQMTTVNYENNSLFDTNATADHVLLSIQDPSMCHHEPQYLENREETDICEEDNRQSQDTNFDNGTTNNSLMIPTRHEIDFMGERLFGRRLQNGGGFSINFAT